MKVTSTIYHNDIKAIYNYNIRQGYNMIWISLGILFQTSVIEYSTLFSRYWNFFRHR